MRRQDEIRLLFPSVDAVCQKLLLSELDAYAQAFDAEDAHDFLWSLTGHAQDAVRWQAQVTLSLFLPRYVAARMGAEAQQASPWSAFRQRGATQLLPAPTAEERATERAAAAQLRAAASAALAPLAVAVARLLPGLPPAVRDIARLGLSYTGSPAALDALLDDFQKGNGGFAALWAYAHGGGARRAPAELADLLTRYGWRQGDALLAGMPLPIDALRQVAQRLAGRLEPAGVANLALALARNPAVDAVRDLAPLLDGAAPWTQVFVLRALALARQPAALPLIAQVHARATDDFVRQHALRAAGALPGPESIAFCADALTRAAAAEVAQALESLVALKCPPERLAELARPHLAAPALRARVNALLAAHAQAPATWPASFTELCESSAPLARVEAAFCLGYWQSQRALKLLALQASADPHPAVRQQAIKSLSKYPAALSYPVLTHLIASAPVAEAQAGFRVLARSGGDAPGPLSDLLTKQVSADGAGSVSRRAMLLRAMGAHAAVSGHLGGLPALTAALTAPERALQLAALESFKQLPEERAEAVVAGLAARTRDADPEVWGAALVARFLGGDVDAVGELSARAASGEPPAVARAVLAFTELTLLAREVLGARHQGLARALAPALQPPPAEPEPARTPDADEGEFRTVTPAPADAPGAADPVAAVQRAYVSLPQDRSELGTALKRDGYIGVVGPRRAPLAGGARTTARPALAAVAAVLLCAGVLVARRGGTHPQAAPARAASTALTVTSVRGRATGSETEQLLSAGDVVRAGADLKLAAGAKVTLVTETGDIVTATAECRAGVDLDPAAGALVIALARGTLELEVVPGHRVLVRWLDATVRAVNGTVKLVAQDGRLSATLTRGEAALVTPAGQSTPLVPGVEAHWP